ncbi:hypothetical protein N7539_000203 [Penicillium diatomitis]|uniref:Fe2OG dioxygenase domain-containing protein n=1 Tax=Penicillium diatomitis TaxID=2819901 RepID=A0A9W9XLC5_9EURO|nr:uncharacterized protein N7539_000203 [Penicillium diatomitis]KAJ5495087.1 hypothetical protein N7539_000203 [Penicillium diatomitis]
MDCEHDSLKAGSKTGLKRRRSESVLQPASSSDLNRCDRPAKSRRGEPPIWANTRQQLVDALDWYHSMQGGAALSDKRCTGFLLDGDNGSRSVMTDEVIITRVGGGSTKDSQGNLTLQRDQSPDGNLVAAMMTTMRERRPVGVIIGSRNKLLDIDIPHRYCVLDWFLITNVWSEKFGSYAGYRFRLEKLDWSKKGWWTAPDAEQVSQASMHGDSNLGPAERMCAECGKFSQQIYAKPGWMCLQPSCSQFWKVGGSEPAEDALFEYHPTFLNQRLSTQPGIPDPGPLAQIFDKNLSSSQGTTSREEWKGIVCPQCHKCIQRITWDAWDCSNDPARAPSETCRYRAERRIRAVPLLSVTEGAKAFRSNQLACAIKPAVDNLTCAPYEMRVYEVPGGGWVTHFAANPQINESSNGPNFLFDRLQVINLGLRRYPLTNSQVPGTLTCHFAVNYGVPYKYVVSVDSRGFSEAPAEILTALGRLSWATKIAVGRSGGEYQPPNELLALGYLEQMKIGFHDDGEKDLGPTIATLSLGSRSRMFVRMKAKYHYGVGDKGVPTRDDPILPGSLKEQERRALRQEFEAGKLTLPQYRQQLTSLVGRSGKKEPPKLLQMELKHGDLLVMHGAELQKYFEHSVQPDHGLRFALTARYIETTDKTDLEKGSFRLQEDQVYGGL